MKTTIIISARRIRVQTGGLKRRYELQLRKRRVKLCGLCQLCALQARFKRRYGEHQYAQCNAGKLRAGFNVRERFRSRAAQIGMRRINP